MKRTLVITSAAILLLAGCGGKDSSTSSASASPSASATSGPAAFQADLARVGFGTKDTSDPGFLAIGNQACRGFASGISFGEQVEAFSDQASEAQAENLVRSAVRNLCPQHASLLP